MLQLQTLSLAGFKSFADPVSINFSDGMTGIVGPNGCGKSNVLEAIRWVMGESRGKALRGESMEDVIFAGTSLRPARGLAEVRLTFVNKDNDAPAPYQNVPEIEVSRNVTKTNGSTFRINGKTVRARDVQLFLNEAGTGASSPAFVNQGQVSALINAKPEARRAMIEEAAGISGLYMRRREAELRLNAASGNLTRVDDIMIGLTQHIETLSAQAIEAERYSMINDKIIHLERVIAYTEWQSITETVKDTQAKLQNALLAKKKAEDTLAAHEQILTATKAELTTAQSNLNEARSASAASEHELIRHNERFEARKREIELLETQITGFDDHYTNLEDDITRLKDMLTALNSAEIAFKSKAESLSKKLEQEDLNVQVAQKDYEEKNQNLNILRAQSAQYEATKIARINEKARLEGRIHDVESKLNEIDQDIQKQSGADHFQATHDIEIIEKSLNNIEELRSKAVARDIALTLEEKNITEQADALRPQKTRSEKDLAALEAEYKLLQKNLSTRPQNTILDDLKIDKHYDRALAVVLGEAADASFKDIAPLYWDEAVVTAPKLHDNLQPLLSFVQNAGRLAPLLSFVGVAHSKKEALIALPHLNAGQMIVTREGDLWRWDGLRVTSEYTPKAALTLANQARCDELNKQIKKETRTIQEFFVLEAQIKDQKETLSQARNALSTEKNEWLDQEQMLNGKRRQLEQKIANKNIELSGLRAKSANLDEESLRLKAALQNIMTQINDNNDQDFEHDIQNAHNAKNLSETQLNESKNTLSILKQDYINIAREQEINGRDSERTATELNKLSAQNAQRASKKQKLHDDLTLLTTDLETFANKILDLQSLVDTHKAKLREAENSYSKTQDALRDHESLMNDKQRASRHTYETWIAVSGKLETLTAQYKELRDDIIERFDVDDPQSLSLYGNPPEGNIESWVKQRNIYIYERDAMGAINMRAPEEYKTARDQFDTLDRERNDLSQAIKELSSTIERINKDARRRLNDTVEQVNELFAPLFVKLFGGGQANLVWVYKEDDQSKPDILNAGIDIMAQPTGKKLQSLSLLSGGEQALTAIALILAMVKTHPAPICVFDEIDAALDESNVDRVSQALSDLSTESNARIVIVSHHRLMMARMDRLFGVTMAERGVSKLVSVDLNKQPELFEGSNGQDLSLESA